MIESAASPAPSLGDVLDRWQGIVALRRHLAGGGHRLALLGPRGEVLAAWGDAEVPLRVIPPAGGGAPVLCVAGDPRGAEVRPVRAYGRLLGYVAALPGPGGEADPRAAEVVASCLEEQAASLQEIESLSRDLLESYEEVNFLYGLGETLGGVAGLEELCRLVVEKTRAVIPVRAAAIYLRDGRRGGFARHSTRELDPGEAFAPDGPVLRTVLGEQKPLLAEDLDQFPPSIRHEVGRAGGRNLLAVPLLAQTRDAGRCLGALLLLDKEGGLRFSSPDLKLLQAVASQTAGLIHMLTLLELKRDMDAAREVQRVLLPASRPAVPGVEVTGRCRPSHQIGGDYYDHVPGRAGGLTVVIADVSGHDLASALFMAQARVVFKEAMARDAAPGELLRRANEVLAEDLIASGLFISAFAARYDPRSGGLEYAGAGHNPPLLFRAAAGRCERLAAEGMLIGAREGSPYGERRTVLAPGDALVLYTDGVVEARSESGEVYGEDRLERLVEGHGGEPPAAVVEGIFAAVEAFAGAAPIRDDVTVVVLGVPGRGGGKAEES